MKKILLSLVIFAATLVFTVKLVSVNAENSAPVLVNGAQIRTDEYAGMRFVASAEPKVGLTYGMVMAKGEVANLTVETEGAVTGETSNLNASNEFTLTITQFRSEVYTQDITVRAYVYDGETYVYSDTSVTRNLAEVATGAALNGSVGDFIDSVTSYTNDNFVKSYTDAFGNIFVNSALYETRPEYLEKAFIKDWNNAFGTSFVEFDAEAWAVSAIDGTTPIESNSDVDCVGTNAYEFFNNAKWNWVLDFLAANKGETTNPEVQINALKDPAANEQALNSFAEFAGSLDNFFAGSQVAEGDVIVVEALAYADVEDYNTTVFAKEQNFVAKGDEIVLEALVKDGYDFDGYSDGENTYNGTYTVNGSVVLVPKFTKKVPTYVITRTNATTPGYYVDYRSSKTFVDELDNGVFVSNNKGVNSSTAYMDVIFTDSGTFTFDYQVSTESGWDKFIIYAKANGESYKKIGSDMSGEKSGQLTFTVEDGDYVCFQYSKDSGGASGSDTVTISNMTFVTDEFYTKSVLSFETNGANAIEDVEVFNNSKINAPADPEKLGYFFDGWYADSELTEEFNFEAGVNADTTIYAKYTKGLVLSYANTGVTEVESQTVRPNVAITAPSVVPTKDGQYFNGWYADEACTEAFDFAKGIEVDTVIYAGWRNPVKVIFDSKGGSDVEDIETDINVAVTLPNEPTKPGYEFAGWYLEEEYYIPFTGANGISETTTVYAKWLEIFTVTYQYGEKELATADVVEGTLYSISAPTDFTELVLGWYTDSALTNEFVNGTVITEDVVLYAKVLSFAPAGVLSSFVNGASSSYEWKYDEETATFTSGNKEKGSSKSILEITFAKESFTAFQYVVNSESNYDFLTIYVNGDEVYKSKVSGKNGVDITGAFSYTFAPGDVLKIQYQKDSSGNQGLDCVVLSNFVINDGVPAANITFKYNDEGVEDAVLDANLNDVIKDVEGFDSYAPVCDDVTRKFGGWYYDEACTRPLKDTDIITSSVVLYARYLYPVTISFWTESEDEIDPITVWTGVAIDNMPEDPYLQGYIFRGWLDDFGDFFNPENGVTSDCTLYAYFEELPKGSTKDVALEIEFENGEFVSELLTTTEEFQNFYFKLVPTTTDYFYFKFAQDYVTVAGSTSNYSGPNYRRYMIVDADGNTIAGQESSDRRILLEEGVTYYAIYNLGYGSTYQWGTFKAEVYTYQHDSASEAIDYEFGTQVVTEPGMFKTSAHTYVYKYVCEVSGTYALKLASANWCSVKVYDDEALSNQVTFKNCSSTSVVIDLVAEAGQTYYIVLGQNWSGSGLVNNFMTFSLKEYPQGYTPNNPYSYNLGDVINAEFVDGNTNYYQVEVANAGTYKLDILSLSDSNSKTIEVYTADMQTKVATLAGAAACEYYVENLEAGTYIIKAFNTSTSYNTSFTASFAQVDAGLYWTTAEDLTLEASMTLNAAGTYYYQFTTSEAVLWHFFEVEGGSVKVYDADRNEVGASAVQLAASTAYFLVVTAEDATVEVTFNTLVDYADGKSPAGAFTYNAENAVLSLDKAHDTYFKFTAPEAGTYRFYTNNNGSIDTKGYLYSDAAFANQLLYNDDGGQTKVDQGITGYKWDFYFEYTLEAGVEYYIKVTYSSVNATSLVLHIENVAA